MNVNAMQDALVRAHEAGDFEGAQVIADEIKRARAGNAPAEQPVNPASVGGTLQFGPIDTKIPLPVSVTNALAGAGGKLEDWMLSARKWASGHSPEMAAKVAEKQRLDTPLLNTTAGTVGSIAGSAVPLAAATFIPGMQGYVGAAGLGALGAALEPTDKTGAAGAIQGVKQAALGAGMGVAGQGLGALVGRAIRPVASRLTPEEQRLAAQAAAEGIPLDAAALTGSKPLKTANAVFAEMPLTAGAEADRRAATQAAFNAAVLRRAGIDGTSATPEVLAAQRSAVGSEMGSIAGRNQIVATPQLLTDLAAINNRASGRLADPRGVNKTFDAIVNDFSSGAMDGAKYQGWRTELGQMAQQGGAEGHFANAMRKRLNAEFDLQIGPADAARWNELSGQYRNLKPIMSAQGALTTAANAGDVSPAQLAAALRNAVGREGAATGAGDLNDLARIGQTFVREQTPNSGTAQRQLMQNMMGAGVLGAAGGVGGFVQGQDPTSAMTGAGIGLAAGMGGPRLAQMLLSSNPAQRYMISGANSASREQAAALARLLLSRPALAAPALVYGQ